jgi:hypothetical protein
MTTARADILALGAPPCGIKSPTDLPVLSVAPNRDRHRCRRPYVPALPRDSRRRAILSVQGASDPLSVGNLKLVGRSWQLSAHEFVAVEEDPRRAAADRGRLP